MGGVLKRRTRPAELNAEQQQGEDSGATGEQGPPDAGESVSWKPEDKREHPEGLAVTKGETMTNGVTFFFKRKKRNKTGHARIDEHTEKKVPNERKDRRPRRTG